MPVKPDSNDFWAQQMLNNLEQNRNLFVETPVLKKASFNPLDAALQDLLTISAQLDEMGLEMASEAVLKVAQSMFDQIDGVNGKVPDQVAAFPTAQPVQLTDLETEVNNA